VSDILLDYFTEDEYGNPAYAWLGKGSKKNPDKLKGLAQFVLVPSNYTSGRSTLNDSMWQWNNGYQNILSNIMKTGQFKSLRSLLIKHYGLDESSVGQDVQFRNAYANALREVSSYNLGLFRQGKTNNILSLMDYLKKKPEGGSGGSGGYQGPTSQIYITGKNSARDTFRNVVNQLTGKNPSKADFEEFYDDLVKAQERYINRQEGRRNQRITQSPFQLENFTLRYIVKKLDISGDMSGQVGSIQDLVDQAAKDYGLSSVVGTNTKIKLIKKLLTGKFSEKDIDDTFRDLARATYSAFAEDIDKNPNISFQDIISPYIQTYNNLLEKTGVDTDVASVIGMATKDGKKMTIAEFQKALMKSDEYQTTSRAKSDASNLAASFARAFGVNV
jgi:hypothetical protein